MASSSTTHSPTTKLVRWRRRIDAERLSSLTCVIALVAGTAPAGGQTQEPARETIHASDALLVIAEQVEVAAAAAGVLRELHVREGSLVEAQAPLLRVDDREAQLAVSQAKVELQRAADEAESDVKTRHAQKARELAVSEHERALRMEAASPSSMSDREIDRLKLAADVAGLEVESAEHDAKMAGYQWQLQQDAYRLAKQQMDEHRVAAPLSGLVVELHKRVGEWVNVGDPVVTLVRVDRLRAEAYLPVAQATLDLTGAAANFATKLAEGDVIEASGKVVFVSPKADPVSALARVWVELPVTDRRLRPGLRGTIRIEPKHAEQSRPARNANWPASARLDKSAKMLGD